MTPVLVLGVEPDSRLQSHIQISSTHKFKLKPTMGFWGFGVLGAENSFMKKSLIGCVDN